MAGLGSLTGSSAPSFFVGTLPVVVGVSSSSYENESDWPPVHLLPKVAKVFDITLDELMSAAEVEVSEPPPVNKRLLKRLEVVEKLPAPDQKMVLRLIDTLAAKA